MNDEVAAVLDDAHEKVKLKIKVKKKYPPMKFLYYRGYLIYTCLPVRLRQATIPTQWWQCLNLGFLNP